MPANLTPQYLAAEQAFKEAGTIEEKIHCLEEMLRVIPKHKGTDHLQGDLRKRLSKLREQQRKEAAKTRKGHSYKIRKEGAGQVALAGMPNTGKSSIVKTLTNAEPETAAYPFTTRVSRAAMMPYKDIKVQLIDLPPLSDEYEEHWVVDLLKAAEAVLLVVDISADPLGQLEFTLKHMEHRRLLPGRIEEIPDQQRVPAAVYRPMIVACNKVDDQAAEEDYEVFRQLVEVDLPVFPVSATTGKGCDALRDQLFGVLNVIRVYSKTPGRKPDLEEPYVLRAGSTVSDFAEAVHRELADKFKYARIWSENKYDGQMVNRDGSLLDGDILELHL
jgi:ribosome-interacting GTPase 1